MRSVLWLLYLPRNRNVYCRRRLRDPSPIANEQCVTQAACPTASIGPDSTLCDYLSNSCSFSIQPPSNRQATLLSRAEALQCIAQMVAVRHNRNAELTGKTWVGERVQGEART